MLKTVLTNSTARRSWQVLALCATGLLAACSNSSNSDDDQIDITLSRSLEDPGTPTLTIQPGESALLRWDAGGGTTSCVASGAWAGDKPTSSGDEGFSTGVINVPGTYNYTLMCSGSFGSIDGTATLTVAGDPIENVVDCGIGVPTAALLSVDGATAAASPVTTSGPTSSCIDCAVNNVGNIVTQPADTSLTDKDAAASFTSLSASGASVTINVIGVPELPATSFPTGPAGFLLSEEQTQLGATRTITVQTLASDGTTVVEEFQTSFTTSFGFTTRPVYDPDSGGFTIQIGGSSFTSVPVGTPIFVGVSATAPYSGLRLKVDTGMAAGAADLRVYAACVGTE